MITLHVWLRLTLAWHTGNVAVEASPMSTVFDTGTHELHYSPVYVYWDTEDKEAWFESRLEASLKIGETGK